MDRSDLSAADIGLLATAAALVLGIRLVLHRCQMLRLLHWLERLAARGARSPAASPERIAFAVEAAAARVPRASCLTQALAAYVLLSRNGHRAEVRLGVARQGERINGHAWAISDARPVTGGPLGQGFTELSTLAARG